MNKPIFYKKIKELDELVCKNLLDSLDSGYSMEINNKYNRLLFFHNVECNFIVERFKIKNRIEYSQFTNFSSDILQVLKEMYGPGKLWNVQVAKLKSKGKILPHIDLGIDFAISHRIHIPLVTNKKVIFDVDGKKLHLEVGSVYEINNLKLHSVVNDSEYDRIHIIFDYVGNEYVQFMQTKPIMKTQYK